MGNFASGRVLPAKKGGAAIHLYYNENAWIEGRAEDQLQQVACLEGVRAVAAFPDLHPGKYGPVGCAVLSDKLHPQLVGSDIGCGMALYALDLPLRRWKPDKMAAKLRCLAEPNGWDVSGDLLQSGLPGDLFAGALGTIGTGNHFCEVQRVVQADPESGLKKDQLCLLVHSGSRGLGHQFLQDVLADGLVAYDPASEEGRAWLERHDQAAIWARLNRQIIAERAAHALRCNLTPISDCAHNLVTQKQGAWLHRKGAAQLQDLVPLAGTRATESFLLKPGAGGGTALNSCAHGAGRRYDRASMHGRVSKAKSSLEALRRPTANGRVICEDKAMLIEEAPQAYKSAADVANDLARFDVANVVATLAPLMTFKHAKTGGRHD
ncbi:RNA ligase RtcB family protein [Rhodobacteraceae bacterium MYP1-1]|uniref:3'-phosphate/5'-hydroxy nucleic acid ligase n=2 Tax=Halocynthiibacter styelae TaxID=2761955 RepID=A0A8J7IY16_9RHOB|nr:RNA ligase RtcB family protein [Paenihalocynthiibacter styelae]